MTTVDYQENIARVLRRLDYSEHNFRFENYADGFVFSRIINPRFLYSRPSLEVDWAVRFTGNTIEEVCAQMTNYYLKEEPESYYSCWIQRKPTFPGLIAGENRQNKPYDYPIDYSPITPGESRFGELLLELHENNILFRIEYVWEGDYLISIINPKVRPTNVETDEINISLHPDLSVSTKDQYQDLIELPKKDWLEQIYVARFEDANEWLVKNFTS